MALQANDVIELVVEQEKDASVILNTYHYSVVTPPSGGIADTVAIQQLMTHLWEVDIGILSQLMVDVMAPDHIIRVIRGQKVHPTRTAYTEKFVVDAGEIEPPIIETANLAWVIVRQTERAGRRGRGTLHMVVPSPNWLSNGALTTVNATERANFASALDDPIIAPGGATYNPVIFHPGSVPAFDVITHTSIKQEIRVMRRRTLRHGI